MHPVMRCSRRSFLLPLVIYSLVSGGACVDTGTDDGDLGTQYADGDNKTVCVTKTWSKGAGDVVWPGDGRVEKWEITLCQTKLADGTTEFCVSHIGYDKNGNIVYGMGPGLCMKLSADNIKKVLLDGKLPLSGWFYYWDNNGDQQWIFPGQSDAGDTWLLQYLLHLYWQWQQPSKAPPETRKVGLNRSFDDVGVATTAIAAVDSAARGALLEAGDEQTALVDGAVAMADRVTEALAYMAEETDAIPALPPELATSTFDGTVPGPIQGTSTLPESRPAWSSATVAWEAGRDTLRVAEVAGRPVSRIELNAGLDSDGIDLESGTATPIFQMVVLDAAGAVMVETGFQPLTMPAADTLAFPLGQVSYHGLDGSIVSTIPGDPSNCGWLDELAAGLLDQLAEVPGEFPYASPEATEELAEALALATGDPVGSIRTRLAMARQPQQRRDCSQYLADAIANSLAALVRVFIAYRSCRQAWDIQCQLRIFEAFTHVLAASAHWLRYWACENQAPIPPAPPGGGAIPGVPQPAPGQPPPALPPPPKPPAREN
jgi:hypothetical protein